MNLETRPEADLPEPGSGAIPPSVQPAITDPDRPILLLVAPDGTESEAELAITLADARARQGRPTILADGGLRDPRMHDRLGVPNLEGLADLFLFGASLHHVSVRPADHAFEFIPAGAYVPDAAGVLSSDRWDRIGSEIDAEGSLLMLFVPASAPGLGPLSRHARRAIILGDEWNAERVADRLDPACEVLGTVDPAAATEAQGAGEGDDAATAGAAAAAAAEAPDGGAGDAELTEPVVFRDEQRRDRAVSPLLLVALIIAVLAAAWFLYREYFSGPPQPDRPAVAEELAPTPEPAAAPVKPEPVETPLGVAVAVAAYQDLPTALEQASVNDESAGGVRFFVAPIESRGKLYYRLTAGPVTDQEAGAALQRWLVANRFKSGYDDWSIRPVDYAYLLGEYEGRSGAEARVDSLAAAGIPAYVVPIRYRPQGERFRVYGGAYENAAEGAVMKTLIEKAGQEAPFVRLVGVPSDTAA